MPIDPSRLQTDKDLPEYLAKLPFDLSHPSRRELRNILVDRYWNQARIVALLDSAELKPGWFALDTSSELAWVDILRETRARDKLHRLLDALLRDSSAAAWHPRLREMLADVPVVAATPPAPPVWRMAG